MALPIYTHIPNLKGLTQIFLSYGVRKEISAAGRWHDRTESTIVRGYKYIIGGKNVWLDCGYFKQLLCNMDGNKEFASYIELVVRNHNLVE